MTQLLRHARHDLLLRPTPRMCGAIWAQGEIVRQSDWPKSTSIQTVLITQTVRSGIMRCGDALWFTSPSKGPGGRDNKAPKAPAICGESRHVSSRAGCEPTSHGPRLIGTTR